MSIIFGHLGTYRQLFVAQSLGVEYYLAPSQPIFLALARDEGSSVS